MKLIISIGILLITNLFASAQIDYSCLKQSWCWTYPPDKKPDSDTLTFTKVNPNESCKSVWYSKNLINQEDLQYTFSDKNGLVIKTYSGGIDTSPPDSTNSKVAFQTDTTYNASGEMVIRTTPHIIVRNYLPPAVTTSISTTEYRLNKHLNCLTVYNKNPIEYKIMLLTADKMVLVVLNK